MFLDARSLADGEKLEADVCIVGAGAAGITIALGLLQSGLRVALLESGGFELEERTQQLYVGRMTGIDTFRTDNHRWRHFGGSTNRWAGFCMPLNPEDFAPRSHIPYSGWPISFDEMIPYYERAHRIVELGPYAWDASPIASRERLPLLPSPEGMLESRFFRHSPPTRFGSLYRARIERSESVTAVLRANVTEIAVLDGRVSHLECAVLGGARFTVEAERVVLASGGLENARLLLASGDRRDGGIANSSGFVGRCFMEHPHLYDSAGWVTFDSPDVRFYRRRRAVDGPDEVTGVIALARAVRDAEGLPDLTISFGERSLDDAETGELRATDVAALGPSGARFQRMTLRAEQTPFPDSRVTLGEDRDELGVPRIELDWKVRDEDLRGYRRTIELLGRELGAAGLGRLWTPTDREGRFDDAIQPGGHHMGTTRMSEDPSQGVVDRNGRCHDVSNLYVAGSSVFTTGGSANPTLTIVALAERLADHLRGGAA